MKSIIFLALSLLSFVYTAQGKKLNAGQIRNDYLTAEDFERAKSINDTFLMEQRYQRGEGGPLTAPLPYSNAPKWGATWALWRPGVVPYTITPGFSSSDRAVIAKAMKYLESVSCLRFVPATNPTALPRIDIIAENLGGYCYSWWTYSGGNRIFSEVHLSPNSVCTVTRTVLHEIFHSLTFYHTHQRPDRDAHIRLNLNNVASGLADEFKICSGCCCDTFGVPYDCDSVMQYASDQMSGNGLNTIEPVSSSCNLQPYGQWNVHEPYLSTWDRELLDWQYGDYC